MCPALSPPCFSWCPPTLELGRGFELPSKWFALVESPVLLDPPVNSQVSLFCLCSSLLPFFPGDSDTSSTPPHIDNTDLSSACLTCPSSSLAPHITSYIHIPAFARYFSLGLVLSILPEVRFWSTLILSLSYNPLYYPSLALGI